MTAAPIMKQTIQQLLALPKDKLSENKIEICGKIVSEIDNDFFYFADKDSVI